MSDHSAFPSGASIAPTNDPTPRPWSYHAIYPHTVENGTVDIHLDQPISHYVVKRIFLRPDGMREHRFIAEVYLSKDGGTPAEANARLIAAAPDLLDACKQALTLFEDDEGTAGVLDAAIAKAEGR